MKTAIIKTDYWKEDKIFELLPDARYFYLCLLTNPERTTTAAFKCSDRLMAAYTGYNHDIIKLCQKELISKKLIQIVDGYYVLNEQDFVQANKGKLSTQLYQKDFNSLPLKVQELLQSRSGVTPEYKDKDNNKDKNIVISKGKELAQIDQNALDLANALRKAMNRNRELNGKAPRPDKPKEIQAWAKDIEMIHRIDGEDWETIYMVLMWCQQDIFWKANILSGKKFREKFEQLLIKANAEQQKKNMYGAEIAGANMGGAEVA